MGNRRSRNRRGRYLDFDYSAPPDVIHLNYDDEAASDASQPHSEGMPFIRGGGSSANSGADLNHNQSWGNAGVGRARTGGGPLSPIMIDDDSENDVFEVPLPPSNLSKKPQHTYRHDGATVPTGMPVHDQFDFNDGTKPLPWNDTRSGSGVHFPSFTDRADEELLAYLESRMISAGFLTEIDQFLRSHPEIASCLEGRNILDQLNILSPLEAYKYFLKGYTRPARYLDEIIKTEPFQLPTNYPYRPLRLRLDPELVDFFDGFEYRHDVIDRIDQEVLLGIEELSFGRFVPVALRKLVCYAIWGNPVDAYKWYEYSYQEDYMQHRYLPEHVVLGCIPKSVEYSEPKPSVLTSSRRHKYVRHRMAKAKDQGVDVVDVLLSEHRMALVRKGHRRVDIDKLCLEAKARLERERQDPTGVDIVDMMMDDVTTRQPTYRRPVPQLTTSARYPVFIGGARTLALDARFPNRSVTSNVNANRRLTTEPGFLKAETTQLRQAKTDLQRLYSQEEIAFATYSCDANMQAIRNSRGRTERRYVNCLIRYLRTANRMSAPQATRLQKRFTRGKTAIFGSENRTYLLGMYPRELN